jgi:hypothetical protein
MMKAAGPPSTADAIVGIVDARKAVDNGTYHTRISYDEARDQVTISEQPLDVATACVVADVIKFPGKVIGNAYNAVVPSKADLPGAVIERVDALWKGESIDKKIEKARWERACAEARRDLDRRLQMRFGHCEVPAIYHTQPPRPYHPGGVYPPPPP